MKLNTFSIIARCQETGNFGAAVATCFPAVGAYSPHIKANCGIIVTQGWVNPLIGTKAIELLQSGLTANETLNRIMIDDPGRELRQVSIIDRYGNCSAYTGIENDEYKGHLIGEQCSVQGNLLTSADVLKKMLTTFENTEGSLAHRLLCALEEGEKAGGDRRGKQSAVIRVDAVDGFPFVDYRVDDHKNPVQELRRIYEDNQDVIMNRYYEWIDAVKQGIKL